MFAFQNPSTKVIIVPSFTKYLILSKQQIKIAKQKMGYYYMKYNYLSNNNTRVANLHLVIR